MSAAAGARTPGGRRRGHGRRRVGLFGILGSGNLGNDGSLEAVVSLLRGLGDVDLDFFCMGPDAVARRYDAPARSLQWYEPHAGDATGLSAAGLKVLGKLLDPFRTWWWARGLDVVVVPGMGVLEATLPLRPWAFPYSLFWLGVSARLTGTKVALVSVGASVVRAPATRWFIVRAARLAHLRSYRDELSRDAMRTMGVDVDADEVYPDLVFALPDPPPSADRGAVGVGIMAYRGGNDDRARAEQLHEAYVRTMTAFVHRLLDAGRPVRLHATDQEDVPVLLALRDDVLASRDAPADLVHEPVTTLPELMERLAAVDVVVGSRFHNVLCGLKLSKPTLAVGYAQKHDALMADFGLAAYCEPARSVDLERLWAAFESLERDAEPLVARLRTRNAELRARLDEQLGLLAELVRTGVVMRRTEVGSPSR